MKIKLMALGILTAFVLTACGTAPAETSEAANTPSSEAPAVSEEVVVSEEESQPENENKMLTIGDTWVVDGQWELTIDSIETTDERNEFDESNPAQVVVIHYTYKNTGYEDKDKIMNGLFLEPSRIVDGTGSMGNMYPLSTDNMAMEVPVGANVKVDSFWGLPNESDKVTLYFDQYDGNVEQQNAVFELPLK